MILTKPAGRGAFLVAKVLAIGGTLAIAVALATVSAWFYTLVLFEALPVAGFAASAVLQWLAIMAFASITFLGSTLTRSALAAAGIGVVAFIVIGVLSAFPALVPYLPVGLGAPARALALGQPVDDLLRPILATLVLIGGTLALAWLSFRRQEL
jgi:ABC-type transport system involved in multi-copper enzyme maturation permease subunit